MAALCLWMLLPPNRLHAQTEMKFSDCVTKATGLIQSMKSKPGPMSGDPAFDQALDRTLTQLNTVGNALISSSNSDLKTVCKVPEQSEHPTGDLQSIIDADAKARIKLFATRAEKKKNDEALSALDDADAELKLVERQVALKIAELLGNASGQLTTVAQRPKAAADSTKVASQDSGPLELKRASDLLSGARDAWNNAHGLTPGATSNCDPKSDIRSCLDSGNEFITDSMMLLPKCDPPKPGSGLPTPVQCNLVEAQKILTGVAVKFPKPAKGTSHDSAPADGGANGNGRSLPSPEHLRPYLFVISVAVNVLLLAAFLAVLLIPLRKARATQSQHATTITKLQEAVSSLTASRTALEGKLVTIENDIKAAANRKVPASDPPFDPYSPPVNHEPLSKRPRERASQSAETVGIEPGDSRIDIEKTPSLNFGGRTTAPIPVNIGIDPKTSAPATEKLVRSTPQPSSPEDDYNRARGMRLEDGEEWFFALYPNHKNLACSNLEQYRNPHVALEFEPSSRGTFLLVQASGMFQYYLFPQLKDDLASARRSLEGVFRFPESSPAALRVTRAARVNQNSSVTGGFQLKPDGQGVIDPA